MSKVASDNSCEFIKIRIECESRTKTFKFYIMIRLFFKKYKHSLILKEIFSLS